MFALLCDIDTLKQLNEQAWALVLLTDTSVAQYLLERPECQRTQANLSRANIRMALHDVVKRGFPVQAHTCYAYVSSDG